MKLKKGILLTILMLVLITIMGTFNSVQAATATTSKVLNIKILRNSGWGYKVINNSEKVIWKIYDVDNLDKNETFYCIKGGPGFGSTDMDSGTAETTYSQYFDMKNPSTISSKYQTAISSIYSTINSSYNGNYAKLMWVLDQCYIPAKSNASDDDKELAQESKKALLDAVEKYASDYSSIYTNTSLIHRDKLTDNLKDDDIDSVQQLAIWYYTNADDYHVEGNPTVKINQVMGTDGNYKTLDINDSEDAARMHAMDALYAYLVKTPQATGFTYNYTNTNTNSQPVKIATTALNTKTSGDRIIVGPYRVEKQSNLSYTLEGTFTDGNGDKITDVILLDSNKDQVDATVSDLVGSNFYISIPSTTNIDGIKFSITGHYFTTKATYWSVENPRQKQISENPVTLVDIDQPIVQLEKVTGDIEDEYVKSSLDLALKKFITSITSKGVTTEYDRAPSVTYDALASLANGDTSTAEKVHTKDPLAIKNGDTILYTIRIYNEGNIDGYATQITDYLPSGLEFIRDSEINNLYGWSNPSNDGETIVTNYLADHKIEAFDKEDLTFLELDYADVQIECKVVATITDKDQTFKNIAEITGHKDIDGNTGNIDRDSKPGNVTTNPNNYNPKNPTKGMGEEDDDDFDVVIMPGQYFDLSLRKFISSVTTSENKVRNIQNREPVPTISTLTNGKAEITYNHSKEPVGVSNGDIITYTIRVYNEGQLDGYATKITDHLPKQLEFIVDDALNAKYGWQVSSDGRTVTTDITSPETTYSANQATIYSSRDTESTDKVLLKAFDGKELDYIDVQIRCKIKENIDLYEKITNIAEISSFTDSEGNTIKDIDSTPNNVTLPTDKKLPEYKDTEIERGDKYISGQEDDDDFEKVELKIFDLSLKKFITGVVSGDKTTDITNRVPVFTKVNGTEFKYEMPKDPVEVANGNIVIYTLRIFNEGNTSGYATEVKDDLPDGLEFLPENSINTAFNWKMYKEDGTETNNVEEASYIKTDFLSKDNESEDGDNLIKAFDPETMTMPDYKDVKVAFKVIEAKTEDRRIINTAEITDDSDEDGEPVDDIDSTPDNNKDDEDDIDTEEVKVKYFDLSLKKWVSEAIVTYNGKTTVTKSGHTGDEETEAPMKIEIQTSKISSTTVKFKYKIKVTNEGEIAGYATEIIDYVPDGLKFVAKDNPYWTVSEDGKVTTDQLKDTLLQPGESATVEITLTWVNGKNNMGQKVNWAEIYKDDNEPDSPDIDSTPGNHDENEDDIDDAPIILSPATGSIPTYITLTLSCIAVIAGGIVLIKKFVI